MRAAGGYDAAAEALRRALDDVAVGHHRFTPQAKVDAFERARGHLSRAVADLWLGAEPAERSAGWALAIETRVIPRLGGLIRWSQSLPERAR